MNFVIALKLPQEQKMQFANLLNTLSTQYGITINGKLFLTIGEPLMQHANFNKLVNNLSEGDNLLFYSLPLSVTNFEEMTTLVNICNSKNVNMYDMTDLRIDNHLYPFLYSELVDISLVCQNYLDFLYRLHTNDFNIPFANYHEINDLDKNYAQFIETFLLHIVKCYKFFEDSTLYFRHLQNNKAYLAQQLPYITKLDLSYDYNSLYTFTELVSFMKHH